MNYIFPETKFVRENTALEQYKHVYSEWKEYCGTWEGEEEEKEEAMDLYHSIETLFRIWERHGVDMGAVQRKVFEKNRRRGYYYD